MLDCRSPRSHRVGIGYSSYRNHDGIPYRWLLNEEADDMILNEEER